MGYQSAFAPVSANCSSYNVQLEEGDVEVVGAMENITIGPGRRYLVLANLKSSDGFEGVGVQVDTVEGSGRRHIAWFSYPKDRWFPQLGEWVKMRIDVGIPNGSAPPYKLKFVVSHGDLSKYCQMPIMEWSGLSSLRVLGYGTSEWRSRKLNRASCRMKTTPFTSKPDFVPCRKPPRDLPPTTTRLPPPPLLYPSPPLSQPPPPLLDSPPPSCPHQHPAPLHHTPTPRHVTLW